MSYIIVDEKTMKACRCCTRQEVLEFFDGMEATPKK